VPVTRRRASASATDGALHAVRRHPLPGDRPAKTVTTADGTCAGVESLNIQNGDTVKYCYAISNPSDVSNPPGAPLYNVVLVDDNRTPADTSDDFAVVLTGLTDIDQDSQFDDLAAGATAYGEALVTITGAAGTQTNTGTASGEDSPYLPTTLTDTDTAAVVIRRRRASTSKVRLGRRRPDLGGRGQPDRPVPAVGTNPQFKFVVSNTGNVALSPVSLTDSDFTLTGCTIPTTLAVGGSFECIHGHVGRRPAHRHRHRDRHLRRHELQ
jgi:hypothetical protein